MQGVKIVKSAELKGILDYKHIHLHLWEHVTQWIECWTQDQKVRGLIPTAGHV